MDRPAVEWQKAVDLPKFVDEPCWLPGFFLGLSFLANSGPLWSISVKSLQSYNQICVKAPMFFSLGHN